MINRKNRVKKLEESSVRKKRLIYPHGYFYDEPNCEPYWTDEPVKDNLDDFYNNNNKK